MADLISDSSDSGYDSTSLAALSATSVQNELAQEYLDPNQDLDLSDYLNFPETTTGTAVQLTQTDANDNHPMWSLVDKFSSTNYENSEELDQANDLGRVWQ